MTPKRTSKRIGAADGVPLPPHNGKFQATKEAAGDGSEVHENCHGRTEARTVP